MRKHEPVLFGGSRFLQVPHLERVILRGRDQNRFYGVKGQTANGVEMASQGELGVPGLPQCVLVVGDLRGKGTAAG